MGATQSETTIINKTAVEGVLNRLSESLKMQAEAIDKLKSSVDGTCHPTFRPSRCKSTCTKDQNSRKKTS